MRLIIEISEEVYEKTKRNDEIDIHDEYEITEAIINGKVIEDLEFEDCN